MLNSCRNVFTGSGEGGGWIGKGGKDKHPPVNTHTWTLAVVHTQVHKRKLKDARWLLMSSFCRALISKLVYGRAVV